MIEFGFPSFHSNSPSWVSKREPSGLSRQSSCASGRDGLRADLPLNDDTPARAGGASALPVRLGELTSRILTRLHDRLDEQRLDEAARRHVEAQAPRIG